MRIFVAGATGVLGRRLVPLLVQHGHQVTGTTRTAAKADLISGEGAAASVLDALDERAVRQAVSIAKPDVIVHELTALPSDFDPRRFEASFASTDRLRTEGTDNLLAAAVAGDVRRIVVQSYAAWPYDRRGAWVKTEDDPLDPDPPRAMRRTLDAIAYVERAALERGLEGIALRYGAFYGPGSSLGDGGTIIEQVRRRRFPVVGSGAGIWSFVHLDDAGEATALAIERGRPGVYNVTDDEPAAVRDWLPVLADAVGARPPRHLPAWLARPLIGEAGVSVMTRIRGASNAKAKRELGWDLRYPTWRGGFRHGLA
jgi:nucleoside-diphosphate-sugar epimerase